jgi:hypothetical protein
MELEKWNIPKPLKGSGVKIEADLLPPAFSEICKNISEAVQVPLDAVVLIALSVVSASTRGQATIKWKNHNEHLAIWSIVALPTGSRKSEMVRLLQVPLFEIEKQIKETGKSERALNRSLRKTLEMQLEQVQRKAAKDYSPENMAEVEAVTRKLENTPEVFEPAFIATDFTPEALNSLLSRNKSIVCISAEGGIIETIAGRYSNGVANLDPLLKGYTGENTIIQRKNAEPIEVTNPHFVMSLCVQPNVLNELMASAEMMQRGFFSRFLIGVPESPIGKRSYHSPALNTQLMQVWLETVKGIHSAVSSSVEMVLSKEAEQLLANAHDSNEKIAGEYDSKRNEPMAGWHSKLLGALVRVAGAYQLFANARSKEISAESMGYALKLISWLSNHASVADGTNTARSKAVLDSLYKRIMRAPNSAYSADAYRITAKEIFDLMQGQTWIKQSGSKGLRVELNNLILKGWLRVIPYERPEGKAGQTPSALFQIHPDFKEFYEYEIK